MNEHLSTFYYYFQKIIIFFCYFLRFPILVVILATIIPSISFLYLFPHFWSSLYHNTQATAAVSHYLPYCRCHRIPFLSSVGSSIRQVFILYDLFRLLVIFSMSPHTPIPIQMKGFCFVLFFHFIFQNNKKTNNPSPLTMVASPYPTPSP